MKTYRQMSAGLYKVNILISKVEECLIAVSMAVLTAVMTYQVITRYFLGIAAPWAEELCRYLFIWTSYIGGAYALLRWEHIEIDLIDTIISKKVKDPARTMWYMKKITILMVVAYLIHFISVYYSYIQQVASFGQISAALKINMLIPMYSGIVGLGLMIFHGITLLIMPPEPTDNLGPKKEENAQ